MAKKKTDKNKPKRDKRDRLDESELPDPDSIVEKVTFVSPKGEKYQIIKTDELDEYEEPATEAESKDSGCSLKANKSPGKQTKSQD